MFFVSEIKKAAPSKFKTLLQEKTYEVLEKLQIPFERVDTDEAISMEDCTEINQKLDMKMVKTLFLCNRKQSEFYLFITAANKTFKSKEFSNALGVSRVSFAPADLMENMLGTKVGAATIFSVLLDKGNVVKIILDIDVAAEEWYGCSDGTTTGYMKIKTDQIVHDFLNYVNHTPTVVQI